MTKKKPLHPLAEMLEERMAFQLTISRIEKSFLLEAVKKAKGSKSLARFIRDASMAEAGRILKTGFEPYRQKYLKTLK